MSRIRTTRFAGTQLHDLFMAPLHCDGFRRGYLDLNRAGYGSRQAGSHRSSNSLSRIRRVQLDGGPESQRQTLTCWEEPAAAQRPICRFLS